MLTERASYVQNSLIRKQFNKICYIFQASDFSDCMTSFCTSYSRRASRSRQPGWPRRNGEVKSRASPGRSASVGLARTMVGTDGCDSGLPKKTCEEKNKLKHAAQLWARPLAVAERATGCRGPCSDLCPLAPLWRKPPTTVSSKRTWLPLAAQAGPVGFGRAPSVGRCTALLLASAQSN